MKPSEILEEEGWCQGALAKRGDVVVESCSTDVTGRCAFGAIEAAYPDRAAYQYDLARKFSDHVGGRITDWNDHPGRTKEEVIAAFKAIGQ